LSVCFGWPLHAVSAFLGHANLTTTARYVNVKDDYLQELVERKPLASTLSHTATTSPKNSDSEMVPPIPFQVGPLERKSNDPMFMRSHVIGADENPGQLVEPLFCL